VYYNAAMHFLIFAGGELHPGPAVNDVIKQFAKVIAADSGALTAVSLDIIPDFVIGDLDSIDDKTVVFLKRKGTKFEKHPKEKDVTDTELAVAFAIKNGATTITILGGVAGDRIDHVLANVFLTQQYSMPIKYVDGASFMWFAKGHEEKITGNPGDILSLIPLTGIEGISTNGLKYVLKNGRLAVGKSRSVSNVFTRKEVTIRFEKGRLLIVHTLQIGNG
jgi:thiamine pyrophosphokinase